MIPLLFFPMCLSKDNVKLSMSPKCFCSFTFGTAVPLKKEMDENEH